MKYSNVVSPYLDLNPQANADRDAQSQANYMQAMLQISSLQQKSLPLNHYLLQLHKIVNQCMHAENFFVAIYNADKSQVSVPYFVDQHDQHFDLATPVDAQEFLSNSLLGYILQRKQPLLADKAKIDRLKQAQVLSSRGTDCTSWLGMPLIHHSQVWGAIAVQSYDEHKHYQTCQVPFFQFVAEQAATCLYQHIELTQLKDYQHQLEDLVDWQVDEIRILKSKLQKAS
ncbi:GAF domain-containing protein [Motilimonas pumila]|uniref:GAF domain-containing protein n=1 Tax=Motilimonas pumila TaxID=2303987 RepID=A0A418YCT5_9GAMM|nr:GAF domain-containing protein [Motilimonas pumila]RJG42304.1 GAF domain-containing protein [Motilimonas pumila]